MKIITKDELAQLDTIDYELDSQLGKLDKILLEVKDRDDSCDLSKLLQKAFDALDAAKDETANALAEARGLFNL